MSEVRVVTVEIGGQQYPIRSALDPTYVAELAAYVDEKMRTDIHRRIKRTAEGLGVAILVALNIADELFRALAQQSKVLNQRALKLEQMLDDVLSQPDAARGGNSRLGLSSP